MRQFERQVVLHVVDSIWREHIDQLDVMRSGIGLRGVAQRDPLVEFKREAYEAFDRLKVDLEHYIVDLAMRGQVPIESSRPTSAGAATEPANERPGDGSRQWPDEIRRYASPAAEGQRQQRASGGNHSGEQRCEDDWEQWQEASKCQWREGRQGRRRASHWQNSAASARQY